MRFLATVLFFAVLLVAGPAPATDEQLTPEQQQYLAEAQRIWDSLNPRQGAIELPGDVAGLQVPDTFYYLDPEDSGGVGIDLLSKTCRESATTRSGCSVPVKAPDNERSQAIREETWSSAGTPCICGEPPDTSPPGVKRRTDAVPAMSY